ncbi:hypothetical protein CEUSTIGMA_g6808.t1 [Chlamydomonas eustigma]|uniref:Uncharacterized protein n=1 Tax=Chlamydomonas eustigma TaxID=1157962 RepID=A0A250X8I2_9CHLO|nr:hypothetical protein CEUSTIGMA_g6808.t1 [Chlamydomonas eustigma]|eukprot:GAX79366.1 hypothetical protein CEUSTIGMA_g6808.t1 [Chlamydomonas eustigma]
MTKASKKTDIEKKLLELQRRADPSQGLSRYHVVAETAREVKRLSSNDAHQERLVREYFREHFKRPESEELLNQGIELEEAGHLEEACNLYQRVLSSEPGNLELRQYVAGVVNKINLRHSSGTQYNQQLPPHRPSSANSLSNIRGRIPPAVTVMSNQQYVSSRGSGSLLDQMNAADRGLFDRPLRKGNGPSVPLSKEDYRAELKRQALDAQMRKEQQVAEDKLLDKKQAEVNEVKRRLDMYNNHVGVGNDKISLNLEMAQHRQQYQERRRKEYEEEQAYGGFKSSGVFAGEGERERLNKQYQSERTSGQWQNQPPPTNYDVWVAEPGQQPRPVVLGQQYSGDRGYMGWEPVRGAQGPAAGGDLKQQRKALEEMKRQARYPGIRPKSAQPRSVVAAFDPPFHRPTIDKPVIPIQMDQVRARQQAWAAGRHAPKAEPENVVMKLSPHNHQRPGDGIPMRADRVEEQLRKAAAQGEAARKLAAAKQGRAYYH